MEPVETVKEAREDETVTGNLPFPVRGNRTVQCVPAVLSVRGRYVGGMGWRHVNRHYRAGVWL